MKKYNKVCLGGTFDNIHIGHEVLLKKAFDLSAEVIIGLTSDEKAIQKRLNQDLKSYKHRHLLLTKFISDNFQETYSIVKLHDDWGPGIFDKDLEAIIVSEETMEVGNKLNLERESRNLPQLEIISISMILGSDGKKVSSTRIRNGEINLDGSQA